MDIFEARSIVKSLAKGVNPVTGEVFGDESPYNHPHIIRALFVVHDHSALEMNCQPQRPLIRDGPFYPMTFVRRNRQVITGPEFDGIRPILEADASSAFQDHHPLVLALIVPEPLGRSVTLGNDPLNPKVVRLQDVRERLFG